MTGLSVINENSIPIPDQSVIKNSDSRTFSGVVFVFNEKFGLLKILSLYFLFGIY